MQPYRAAAVTILSYIAMFLSVTGNLFVNRKKVIGMYLWLGGSLLWVIFAAYHHTWSQLIMFGVYTVLNVEGIIRWRRQT